MRWSLAGVLGLSACVFCCTVPVLRPLGVAGLGAAMIALVWRLGVCRHPGPLGLLPPVTNPDGTRSEAQWYCDRCGKSWAAAFEHQPRLVRRFDGFDQSKAVGAARRAEELTKHQRRLALRRAGLGPVNRAPRVRANPAEVVPLAHVRQFVK
jgi:hypothetical protein